MEPPQHGQARRRTGSTDQVSFEGDDSDGRQPGIDADGSPDHEPDPWSVRFDEHDDWLEARRREQRRERERRWEQLELVT